MSRRQGLRLAGTTGKVSGVIETVAVGLFRWAATDHSGMGKALEYMPPMGFLAELKTIFMQFLISVVGAILTGGWIFALFAYVIPNLIVWLL